MAVSQVTMHLTLSQIRLTLAVPLALLLRAIHQILVVILLTLLVLLVAKPHVLYRRREPILVFLVADAGYAAPTTRIHAILGRG